MATAKREIESNDFVLAPEEDGVISWNELRLGLAAIEIVKDGEVRRTSAEIERFMQDELLMLP